MVCDRARFIDRGSGGASVLDEDVRPITGEPVDEYVMWTRPLGVCRSGDEPKNHEEDECAHTDTGAARNALIISMR